MILSADVIVYYTLDSVFFLYFESNQWRWIIMAYENFHIARIDVFLNST